MSIPLSAPIFPRRLTRLFADNKKSYEALVNVNTNQTAPELSHLNLRLRIQKDRLIAWGIQWSDRSAGHGGDIDSSLDRAGISDLVASIMCSIRLLLDEAEAMQPPSSGMEAGQSTKMMTTPPSGYQSSASGQWADGVVKRLEEILKDLTTSIDTLCDLSRPKMEGFESAGKSDQSSVSAAEFSKELHRRGETDPPSPKRLKTFPVRDPPPRRDDLADMTYIEPSVFRIQRPQDRPTASPPSYESIAAGSENRAMARFSSSSSVPGSASAQSAALLDYRQATDGAARPSLPDKARFEELLLALLKLSSSPSSTNSGILKLTGWTVDAARRKYAYVYEVPQQEPDPVAPSECLQPRSLLSFLQNGGDAESNNTPCLESRFRLALNIATSVKNLHDAKIAHRNINSNNLLYFLSASLSRSREKIWKGRLIRDPYLTGFHPKGAQLAAAEQESSYTGLYYHPKLFGPGKVAYNLMHDYYSLGLVLLEIGLWMPIGKFWKSRYSLGDFKVRLQDIYLRKLSGKCGEGYMNAVLFCMTAAETLGRSLSMMTSATSMDDIVSYFRRNVLVPLQRCCRIDGDTSMVESPSVSLTPTADAQFIPDEAQKQMHGPRRNSRCFVSEQGTQTADPMETPVPQTKSKSLEKSLQPEGKITVWSHELPQLYSSYWSDTMYPKLERILRKAISRWESYSIDLFMAGDDPDTARPTVYMECMSTKKVQRILRFLNKDLRLFDIRVVAGQIVRSKKKGKKAKSGAKAKSRQSARAVELNPHYQEKPSCGASIGAYLNGNHLPPVTLGGAILVDGKPFGMSVHHMLEDDEEIEAGLEDVVDLRRSMATAAHHDDGESPFDRYADSDTDDVSSTGYAFSDYSNDSPLYPSSPQALYPFDLPDDVPDRWADAFLTLSPPSSGSTHLSTAPCRPPPPARTMMTAATLVIQLASHPTRPALP